MVQERRYSSSTFFTLKTQRLQHLTPYLQSTLAYEPRGAMGQILSRMTANEKMVKALGSLPHYHSNGTRTVIIPNPETGEETTTVLLHHRYIYRGYLQIATCDLTRSNHPCLWLIIWEIPRGLGGGLDKPKGFAHRASRRGEADGAAASHPTQPVATRPLAIQKDGTWYCYGWDLTKNICEIYSTTGYIRTVYTSPPTEK